MEMQGAWSVMATDYVALALEPRMSQVLVMTRESDHEIWTHLGSESLLSAMTRLNVIPTDAGLSLFYEISKGTYKMHFW